eukprot:8016667-Alexandrium_andersonii.AAC.1
MCAPRSLACVATGMGCCSHPNLACLRRLLEAEGRPNRFYVFSRRELRVLIPLARAANEDVVGKDPSANRAGNTPNVLNEGPRKERKKTHTQRTALRNRASALVALPKPRLVGPHNVHAFRVRNVGSERAKREPRTGQHRHQQVAVDLIEGLEEVESGRRGLPPPQEGGLELGRRAVPGVLGAIGLDAREMLWAPPGHDPVVELAQTHARPHTIGVAHDEQTPIPHGVGHEGLALGQMHRFGQGQLARPRGPRLDVQEELAQPARRAQGHVRHLRWLPPVRPSCRVLGSSESRPHPPSSEGWVRKGVHAKDVL